MEQACFANAYTLDHSDKHRYMRPYIKTIIK